MRHLQDRLPEIIELGLRQRREQAAPTPRQRVEQLWEAEGLIEPAAQSKKGSQGTLRKRHKPISAGGQPASELIIQQRGAL